MKEFSIRKATVDDIPLILEMIKSLAKYEKLLDEVVATEDVLRNSLFENPTTAEVIIGYYDNNPVGFALFFHNFSTFLGKPGLYLEDLYIQENMRGKGFGKKLLSHLAKIAKERGCERLEWWVLDWNKPSIEFYKKLGAEPMEDWTVYRVTGKSLDKLSTL